MTYTPPTFVNNSPPALNATNMQGVANAAALALQPTRSTTAPTSPGTGQFWEDTNTSPATLKMWTGSVWEVVGGGSAGVPGGGVAGKLLGKVSATDYDTDWWDIIAGSGVTVTKDTTARSIAIASLSGSGGTINGKVASISALRAVNSTGLIADDFIIAYGYHAAADKAMYLGQPMWYRVVTSSSLADNSGSVIKPTDAATPGKRFVRLQDPTVQVVTQWGARGTDPSGGTNADDMPFITAAVDALSSTTESGCVFYPPGIYGIDTGMNQEDQIYVAHIGLGTPTGNEGLGQLHGTTFKLRSTSIAEVFSTRKTYTITGSSDTKHSGSAYLNLNFRNGTGTVRTGTAIRNRLQNRGIIRDCYAYDLADFFVNVSEQGGYGDETGTGGATDASWWDIDNCHTWKCMRSVYVPHSGNVTIRGGSAYGPGPSVVGSRGYQIMGGGHHIVDDPKVEESEIGIDYQASMGRISFRSEDCKTACRVNRFSATSTASGQLINIDNVQMARNTVLATDAIGIDIGPNVDAIIGPNRQFKGYNTGRKIINNGSTSLKVITIPAAVASNYTE